MEEILGQDAHYLLVKDYFTALSTATGRGRKPDPPLDLSTVPLNKKLLLCIQMYKEESSASYPDITVWFSKLKPELNVSDERLRGVLARTWAKGKAILDKSGEGAFVEFCLESSNLCSICPSLNALHIDRNVLFNPCRYSPPAGKYLSNLAAIEMERFINRNSLPFRNLKRIVEKFMPVPSADALQKSLAATTKIYQNLRTGQRKQHEFKAYCTASFNFQISDIAIPCSSGESDLPKNPNCYELPSLHINDKNFEEIFHSSSPALTSTATQTTNVSLTDKGSQCGDIFEKLMTKIKSLQADNKGLKDQLNDVSKSQLYRKNCNYKKDVENFREDLKDQKVRYDAIIKEQRQEMQKLNDQISFLKQDKLNLQKHLSKTKKTIDQLRRKGEAIDSQLVEDLCKDESQVNIRTKVGNQYSDDTRITLLRLHSEAGVAATKCAKAINIVVETLLKQKVSLPHPVTVCRIVYEGAVLARHDAAERILNSENVVLHTDGTSRDKRKYVCQQATLGDGTNISLGFSQVASEDSDTLLELTLSLFQSLIDVYEDDQLANDRDELLRNIVSKVVALMSDRASVNKCFNKKFEQYRSELVGDAAIDFLYCNAHFLLGLSKEAESALKCLEEEEGRPLGRDADAKFKFFKKDLSTFRLLRCVADVLGPRGDDKNGCQDEWRAFCIWSDITSEITTHRSNRFNNIFDNAYAIFHHRDEIKLFLKRHVTHSNLKLQSILLDISDDSLILMLACLALLGIHVASPFWNLVRSDVPYSSFYTYVNSLHDCLSRWSECSSQSELLVSSFSGIFAGEFSSNKDCTALITYLCKDAHVTKANHLLQMFSKNFLAVAERQLGDFLHGKYSERMAPEVADKMKHFPLTNLCGEHAFGYLDYDLSARRNCPLLARSTRHMLKLNDTMKRVNEKDDDEKERLMKMARKGVGRLKEDYKRQEEMVKLKIEEKIIENERKLREAEVKEMQNRQEANKAVREDGGLCQTRDDVVSLSKAKGVNGLKNQLRYLKLVLGVKGAILTGKKIDLEQRLIRLFNFETGTPDDEPQPKRPKIYDESAGTEGLDTADLDYEDTNDFDDFSTSIFKFSRQGEWVAVYYDLTYYIGQVTQITNEHLAVVSFLEKAQGHKQFFKWPKSEDVATVEAEFVFRGDVTVSPASNNFRLWVVQDVEDIESGYLRITRP